jgi:diguanylate cyclase (GGDEF)-like protein
MGERHHSVSQWFGRCRRIVARQARAVVDRDQLTGLRSGRALAGVHGPVAAIWIDVDHLKAFNDREGAAAGDVVIGDIATAIRDAAGDVATHRVAGDEFLVVLPGGGLDDAAELAERIRAAVEAATPLTVTAGVAAGRDVAEAWKRAEPLATEAKSRRNTVAVAM